MPGAREPHVRQTVQPCMSGFAICDTFFFDPLTPFFFSSPSMARSMASSMSVEKRTAVQLRATCRSPLRFGASLFQTLQFLQCRGCDLEVLCRRYEVIDMLQRRRDDFSLQQIR